MIAFRPLEARDFPLLLAWLQRPHVKQWWDDGDNDLEKVAAHYGDADGTRRFVLELDGAPAGYFQYYRVDADTIGSDQFLARPDDLSKGIGARSLLAFIGLIESIETPRRLVVDPHPDNERAIRCYHACGFRHDPQASGPEVHFMARDCGASARQSR